MEIKIASVQPSAISYQLIRIELDDEKFQRIESIEESSETEN